MSLYELESLMRSIPALDPSHMTAEKFDATKDKWRRLNLPDVKV